VALLSRFESAHAERRAREPFTRRARRALPFLAGALFVAMSCDGSGETGNLDMEVFDAPVWCVQNGECFDDTGALVLGEPATGFAFLSTEPSQFEDGLFLYFDLVRADGTIARGELDVPRRGTDLTEGLEPDITYVEHTDGVEVFRADEVTGVIVVPDESTGERCDCLDGRFELALRDFGDDGEANTDDDRVRRLSRAIFGWGTRRCLQPIRIGELGDGVVVDITVECPPALSTPPTTSDPIRRDPRIDDTVDAGCSGSSSSTSSTDSGSCDGDSSSGSGSSCGDSSGSGSSCDDGGSSSSSSGSCDGDSSSGSGSCDGDSSSGSGSCDGDSSSGSGSCSGDSSGSSSCSGSGGGSETCADGAAVAPPPRAHTPRRPSRLPRAPLQMIGFITLALGFLRRR
jgi:hypothetical protein